MICARFWTAVEEKPQFEIDLREEWVSHDAILQDEEKMVEINEKLEKLILGSCAESIRNDLSKGSMLFSKKSSRAVNEVGNMEMTELRQISAIVQCLSCPKRVLEGMNMCQCGVWLRPNQSTLGWIRITFAALQAPYYRIAVIQSRGF